MMPQAIAADAMTSFPFTVRPDAFLTEVTHLMVDHHVRHVPIVDTTSTIVGMVSDRDIRSAVGDPERYTETAGALPLRYRARDVMSKPPIVVRFDTPLNELARRFAEGEHGAYAVVDNFGALIGILSYVDALRVLAE
jgi:acetoin utilization protein AcuB